MREREAHAKSLPESRRFVGPDHPCRSGLCSASVDLPGGVQALYALDSLVRFRYPDWLGTIRAESNPSSRTFTVWRALRG